MNHQMTQVELTEAITAIATCIEKLKDATIKKLLQDHLEHLLMLQRTSQMQMIPSIPTFPDPSYPPYYPPVIPVWPQPYPNNPPYTPPQPFLMTANNDTPPSDKSA